MSVLVGIDVGTTATKGIAIDPRWHGAGPRRSRVRPLHAKARLGRAGPRGLVARHRDRPRSSSSEQTGEPEGIGLSGQMHGLVALDENDNVLRPAILWNDQRTQAECDEIESTIGLDRLIELTGNRALTGFTAPKILWLRHNEPDIYARIKHIALPKDYVRLKLTGEHATDVSDASGTLLLDVAKRRWSDEVLTALNIDRDWLPEALESPTVSGHTPRRNPGRGRCRRPGRGRARRRGRPTRPAVDRARHLGRRLRSAKAIRRGPTGARSRFLPRRAGRLARHGRDAVRRGLAHLAAQRRRPRHQLRRASGNGGCVAGGNRKSHLPPLPRRRAHAPCRP